jgi:hypothetical protein
VQEEQATAAKKQVQGENWKSFSDNFWIMMMTFPFSVASEPASRRSFSHFHLQTAKNVA